MNAKYIIWRFLVHQPLAQEQIISDTIKLIPDGFEQEGLTYPGGAIEFGYPVFYLEECYDDKKLIDHGNLKNFIRVYTFVMQEALVWNCYKYAFDSPKFSECLPVSKGGVYTGTASLSDLCKVQIRINLNLSEKVFKFSQIFCSFINLSEDEQLRAYIKLYCFQYEWSGTFLRVNNYPWIQTYFNYMILDAHIGNSMCQHSVICDNLKVDAMHWPDWENKVKVLLSKFDNIGEFYKSIKKFKNVYRNNFFHHAKDFILPDLLLPDYDSGKEIAQRESDIEDTLENWQTEQLAAINFQAIFNSIIYSLLINQLLPELNFWPNVTDKPMKMIRIGGAP